MKYMSLKTRVNLLILTITVLVAVLVGFLLFSKATAELEDSLGMRLMNLAQVSAMLIDSTAHASLGPGDENTDTYIQIRDILRQARDKYGAIYVYTLSRKNENTATFVIDTDNEPAAIGEEYEMSESMKEAFNGTASFEREMSTDQWGTFKSGYAPIISNSGKVDAILGVDYDARQVVAIKKDLLLRILIPVILSLIICIVCGMWVTKKIISEISGASSKLKDMSKDVTDNIQNTNDIGQQIATAFNQISCGAAEQADNLENVSEQMQEFVQSINQIRNHAQESSESSDKVVKVADEGKHLIQSIDEKITAISTGMQSLNEVVTALDKDSKKIEGIVEIIFGIAEQTKLLALNASIEAARAGESGRGFAVVADEVGKLADNSGGAVKEINQLITEVRNKILKTVNLMEQSKAQVEEGTAAFCKTGGALDQIVSHSQQAAVLVQQIVDEIDREKEVVHKVSHIIQSVTGVAQQNAASSQEVASSIEEQAANLEAIVDSAKELNSISEKLDTMT